MEGVTNTVTETANSGVNVVKGATDDIIQLQFYKNPVFIVFVLYIIIISVAYSTMDSATKNSYVFSDKFRDSANDIHWLDIISYPYDFKESTSSKLKTVIFSPIMLYLLLGLFLTISVVDPLQKRNQAYFYSVMCSFLFILIIFVIHVIIFHFIIDPKKVKVELKLGDQDKVKKTYEAFYRTQWLLLAVFSPIIISLVVYAIRKLGLTTQNKS